MTGTMILGIFGFFSIIGCLVLRCIWLEQHLIDSKQSLIHKQNIIDREADEIQRLLIEKIALQCRISNMELSKFVDFKSAFTEKEFKMLLQYTHPDRTGRDSSDLFNKLKQMEN